MFKKWMVMLSLSCLTCSLVPAAHAAENWLEMSNNQEEGESISMDVNSLKRLKNGNLAVSLKMSYDKKPNDLFQMGLPLSKVLMHLEIKCSEKAVQRLRMELFKYNSKQVGQLNFADDNIQFGGGDNSREMATGICDLAKIKMGK